MSLEHSAVTDPNIHEPKGVASASAKKSYLADGLGSGSWSHNSASMHGNAYVDNDSISVGATGGTITTDAHYSLIGATWTLDSDSQNVTLHSSNAGLEVPVAGTYLMSMFAHFTTGATAAGTKYALKHRVNASATLSVQKLVSQSTTAGADSMTLSGTTTITLAAGDYVQLMLGSSTADTVTVVDAALTLVLLNEV